jgi:hypothetical protein
MVSVSQWSYSSSYLWQDVPFAKEHVDKGMYDAMRTEVSDHPSFSVSPELLSILHVDCIYEGTN